MSIVVVGSVAYDTLATPYGRRERVLGGSASYFSLAASFFTPVRVVAVVGDDFDSADEALLAGKGIDLSGLSRAPGPTFHWTGEYHDDMNTAHTLDTRLGVFADFAPKLSEAHRGSPFVFLANIDPKLQGAVLDQMISPRIVAMDTMNYWITSALPGLRRTLARVDVLLVNDGEAKLLSGASNVMTAARRIREMGPRSVCIKRGEYGVIVFHEAGMFAVPAYPLETVVDPTGAGDSFGGAFLGYLASRGEATMDAMRTAAVYGSTVASFACEDFSVGPLVRLTRADIEERFELFRELTRF
ncbi:MAG: sugar kinase [Deltaproteobacteria bacterium]|nr:sugar kinase [Deltaproteobacteria bacterium]